MLLSPPPETQTFIHTHTHTRAFLENTGRNLPDREGAREFADERQLNDAVFPSLPFKLEPRYLLKFGNSQNPYF